MSDLTPVQAVEHCISLLEDYKISITPTGNVINVRNGQDIQDALLVASPGDTILVQPGVYPGIIVSKNGVSILPDATIPAGRLDPLQTGLIELKPRSSGTYSLQILGNGVNMMGFKADPTTNSAICVLGGDNTTLDRYLMLGNPTIGQRRAIACNGSNINILNGYVDDIFNGSDAQAIEIWNGSGPFKIDNNFLSASTETVLSGGADSLPTKQPGNLTFTNNYVTKKTTWKSPTAKVKNAFELKDMIGATITDNIFENSWQDGQTGYLLLITPRNQDNTEPYAQVAHITIQRNIFRNSGAGIQILGSDNIHPSQQTVDINILDNQFDALSKYAGSRIFVLVTGTPGALNVTVQRNKVTNSPNMNSFLTLDSPLVNLVFSDNDVPEGEYGVKATGVAPGIASWNAFVTGGEFARNVIHYGGVRHIDYGGNGNIVVP